MLDHLTIKKVESDNMLSTFLSTYHLSDTFQFWEVK